MTRYEMLRTARRELAHIPDWPQHQRTLRAAFWNMRLNSLGRRPAYPNDPLAVVEAAIRLSQASNATEIFEFDRAFFEAESAKGTSN